MLTRRLQGRTQGRTQSARCAAAERVSAINAWQVRVDYEAEGQQAKIEPGSVEKFLLNNGRGIVQIIDDLFVEASPTTPRDKLPCGWAAVKGKCLEAEKGECRKCANGEQPSVDVLRKAKALCSAKLLSSLPKTSPLRSAK